MTFVWTLIFMTMVFWRPQEWLVPWMFGWPLLDIVVVCSLIFLMMEVNEGRVRFPKRLPQVYLLAGLWVASVFVSHAAHTYFQGMLDAFFPVFKMCFFTLLFICVLDRPTRLRQVAMIYVIMAMTIAWHCMLQQERGYGFGGVRPMYVPQLGDEPAHLRSRFVGIFADPNDTAQFLASAIPFAFVLTKRKSGLSFLMGCAISAFIIHGVLITHSRGGLLGLIAVFGVFIALRFPPRWMPKLVMIGLLAALAMCPFANFALDASARERVVYWGMANWAFKRNFIFGLGYGMFWQVIPGSRACHNAFVSCYTEIGIVGYWFWFGLIQIGVVSTWRVREALRDVRTAQAQWLYRFSGMALASMGGFCASGYFLSRTFVFPMFFMMGILAALPAVARRYLPPDHPPIIMRPKKIALWITIGAVASVIYIYISIILLNKAWGG